MKAGVVIGWLAGISAALLVAQDRGGQVAPPAPPPVYRATTAQDAAMAQAIAQWKVLQQTDSLPFDSYAGFVMAHPGWPGQAANRRAAERHAASAAPAGVVAFCRRFAPLTATGWLACARANLALGNRTEADAAARSAWRMGALAPADESAILTGFTGALTPADHDARMDALLWQGQTSAAVRQLPLTGMAGRPLFAARLAFRTQSQDAAALATANDAAGAADAGYIADKATWLRNTGASLGARGWLARTRGAIVRPGNVEKFYDVLLTNARGAAVDAQWQNAYDIARQIDDAYPAGTDVSTKPYAERDGYTSLAWLAGQAALNRLGRPADAAYMFQRYGAASLSPQTRAKGFYWAARAAEVAGQADATALYEQAAGYRDQYYGQLATEHLRRALAAPPPVVAGAIDPAVRAAFYNRETVRAAQMLGQIGQHQDQTAFVKQIAADVSSDTDHLLADELSRTIGRPDLAVLVGRNAMQNGRTQYSAVAFPTVPVPGGFESQWTLIHAVSRQESQFDRAAISNAGARGLMQLMPATARETAGKLGLAYDPARLTEDTSYNVMLGSTYFQRLFGLYGSYPLAIAAYNAGPGNVNKWLAANGDPRTGTVDTVDWVEAIPYSETRNYVQRVLENAVVYDLMNPARAKSRGPANLSWYLGRGRTG